MSRTHRKNLVKLSQAVLAAAALLPATRAVAFDEGQAPVRFRMQDTRPQSGITLNANTRYQLAPQSGPSLNADGTFNWLGGDLDSWGVATNWDPTGIPDGPAAIANITGSNGGGAIVVNGTFAVNTINVSDPNVAAIGGGTLNFAGTNPTINSTNTPVDPPGVGVTPTLLGFTGSLTLNTGGTNGLRVVSDNSNRGVSVFTPQNFSGGLFITNARYQNRSDDGGMGAASNNVTLTNGEIWMQGAAFSTNRAFTSAGSSTITLGPASAIYTFNGNIGGTGHLNINGNFGGSGVFTAANTHSGSLTIGFGTQTLSDSGAFASVSQITQVGTLVLNQGGAASNVNRISNTATINLQGAGINIVGNPTAYDEVVGALNLEGGNNFITMTPGGGGAQIHTGDLTRSNAAGLAIRGQNLGSAPGGGNVNVFINNGTSLVSRGVIPFAYGHNLAVNTAGIEHPNTNLLTYGANGVEVISGQASDFTGSTTNTNVRLTSDSLNQAYSVAANTRVNTLVLAPGFDGDGNGVNGITLNGGKLFVDGGVILSASSGFTPGGAINSGIGNIINAAVDAGTAQLVLSCPGALTTNGTFSGSGGLTKTGARTWFAYGTSDYTGTTTIASFSRFRGNVLSGVAGPYGADTSPIELYGGTAIQNDPVLGATGVGIWTFGPDAGAGSTLMTRGLNVHGSGGGVIRNFSGAAFTMNGPINIDAGSGFAWQSLNAGANTFILNGQVSGAGTMGMSTATGTVNLTINSANTFTGGFDMDGFLTVGNDAAFGTGTLSMSAAVSMTGTAPRTFANTLLLNSGALTFTGANPITFTGEGFLDGATFVNNASATVTFSGALHHNDFFKTGAGTVVLSGNSDYDGTLSAGSGTIAGGMIILRSNNAAGSVNGQSQAVAGSTVAVDGGITVPDELFIFNSEGIGGLGALRSLSGNNTWGGRVVGIADGTISNAVGVDAGSTLTISRDLSTNAGTLVFTMNKVGGGQLNVGSTLFNNGAGGTFNGAMLINGPLNVNAGTLRVTPGLSANAKVSDVQAVSIAGGTAAPTAKLDLTNTGMVIDYTGASPITDVRLYLQKGYNAGAWNGNGIISSTAATSPNPGEGGKTGLGYLDNALLGTPLTTFLGDVVDTTAVLIKYTYQGDTNLDGQVDITDLGALATSWQQAGNWVNGDSDYNGFIDITDLGALATNWQVGVGSPLGPSFNDALAAVGLGGVSVPEPATVSLLTLGAMGVMSRRRRQ